MVYRRVRVDAHQLTLDIVAILGTLVDALFYLNDEHDRTEDCIAIRACYIPPPSEHGLAASATAKEAAKRDAGIAIDKARRAANGVARAPSMVVEAGDDAAPVAEEAPAPAEEAPAEELPLAKEAPAAEPEPKPDGDAE